MKEKNEKDFIPILKAHGLKVTFQRLAIYQALILTNGEHPSVDFIYQHTKKSFPMISLGTVYKTLDKFCEVGLIQKVNPITETARYDTATGPHHYIICMKCQSILNADNMVEEPKVSDSGQNGFHVLRRQVFLHGYCPSCKDNIAQA
jgi:Fur family peroxide stress response transcriptional regulator